MNKIYNLIDDNSSPLFRILSVPTYRIGFENNILCFHIGNGYFLSVAHNLLGKRIPEQLSELEYTEIRSRLPKDGSFLGRHYNQVGGERLLANMPTKINENIQISNKISTILSEVNFNHSYEKFYERQLFKPFLLTTFKKKQFYNNAELTKSFKKQNIIHEQLMDSYTFMIELELKKAFYEQDIAVYKAVNTNQDIIDALPKIGLDFTQLDNLTETNLFCLQSAPNSELGRMVNNSILEGVVENVSIPTEGQLSLGKRYLTKNYFRFGSSGAPYLTYNKENQEFLVNAIQSEACPIQMLINNNRDNLQYTHSLATPLFNIKEELLAII